jgi:hypothetical protein
MSPYQRLCWLYRQVINRQPSLAEYVIGELERIKEDY